MFIMFFRAAYNLYLFSLTQHGNYLFSKGLLSNGRVLEYLVVFLHWVPLNLLILRFYLIVS